jgi:hypothetical protein
MSTTSLQKFPYSEFGFTWNDEDSASTKWRPQGLTEIKTTTKEFMAVSWYGREEELYDNRGVRIAFVDLSTMMYRLVLLVDENYKTFQGMHSGGLVYYDNYIHVPDSRSGTKKIYQFNINNIQYVPESDRDLFYSYAYILPRSSSYNVPITPSFLSYDWDRKQIVLGTFFQCSSYHTDSSACLSNTTNKLSWYTIGNVSSTTSSCSPFYSEMQGVASALNPKDTTKHVLWSVSSYGSGHSSHLHISNMPTGYVCNNNAFDKSGYKTISYPPGLEDMHVCGGDSSHSGYLWMHTEFGSNDGTGNIRSVFATKITNILP